MLTLSKNLNDWVDTIKTRIEVIKGQVGEIYSPHQRLRAFSFLSTGKLRLP